MSLSPRQIVAYQEFNAKLDRNEQANALATAWIGAQGDRKAVDKVLRELNGQH